MLLAAIAQRLGIPERLAGCIEDPRAPERVRHTLAEMIRFRALLIAVGYPDGNDCAISRLENLPGPTALKRMMAAMVEVFCDTFRQVPRRIVLDIDDTEDRVHGGQQLALWNASYDSRCFQPIQGSYPSWSSRLLSRYFIVAVLWQDITLAAVHRFWFNLIERPSRTMAFRFILQPVTATMAAIHDGVRDGRTGRSPYFWTIAHDPETRLARLREGLNATAKIILLGLGIDIIYQVSELRTFYLAEAVVTAVILAFFPYLLIRGPVARIVRRFSGGASKDGPLMGR